MSVPHSELIEISKLNGDFKRNYGRLLGAYLYLRSIGATRGRSLFWTSLVLAIGSAGIGWLQKHNLNWLR
jgi:hypothetical protein